MTRILILLSLMLTGWAKAQTAWPSESWNAATPLTSVMNAGGLLELSGLHWNPETNRLYVVHGDGRVRILQLDEATNTFTQIGNKTISSGPEGITQANLSANEFYTIDENNYEIRKYTHNATFSTVTEARHWDLLVAPSPMQDTGNTGPEGIVFIPDANLTAAGFISSETEMPYTSTKGAGGLFFIAHQDGGYIWVFDINPEVTDDFAYVGKYGTNRTESCDLAFDRSTNLMYILHNTGSNYVEVTDLSLAMTGETKFNTVAEYFISNPTSNVNIEGFSITPKCADPENVSVWLCRDVENDEATEIKQDAIRWFNPFVSGGDCMPLKTENFVTEDLNSVYPNPGSDQVTIHSKINENFTVRFINALGQVVLETDASNGNTINIAALETGIYIIEIKNKRSFSKLKWIKK